MTTLFQTIFFLGWLLIAPGNHPATVSGEPWPEELNTAKDVVYLTKFEKEVIFELNKVRSDPAGYAAQYLEPLHQAFEGLKYTYPGKTPVMTNEGVVALDNCIKALREAPPVPALQPSKGLSGAAKLLVNDQKLYGGLGHITKSGWTVNTRVNRFGEWKSKLAENISYGNDNARQLVISLLIDDGVDDRSHRGNVLDPEMVKVGVAADTHPTYKNFCTIIFVDDFTEAAK